MGISQRVSNHVISNQLLMRYWGLFFRYLWPCSYQFHWFSLINNHLVSSKLCSSTHTIFWLSLVVNRDIATISESDEIQYLEVFSMSLEVPYPMRFQNRMFFDKIALQLVVTAKLFLVDHKLMPLPSACPFQALSGDFQRTCGKMHTYC